MPWEPPSNKLEFPDLGNALAMGAHAAYYGQEARTKAAEEQRRTEALPSMEAAARGEPAAMAKVATGAPKEAVALATMLGRVDADKRANLKAQADYAAQAASAVLQANPAERADIYRQLRAEGERRGYNMGSLPPEYSPQLDPVLRGHRALAIDINKELDRQTRLQIHNTPGGGSGGELAPIIAPAPAAAAPPRTSDLGPPLNGGFAPPDVRQATAMPQGQPPPDEGTFLSADPSIKTPPQRSGPVFFEDPAAHGYVIAQDRRKPGQPVIDEHGIRYIHPQTKEVVIFKPEKPVQNERAQPPAGYQRGPEGGLAFIPGGPADPAIARRSAPMNNEQARDAGFADRMTNSNGLLEGLEGQGTKFWERLSEKAPTAVQGYVQDPNYQKFRQARDDFINAQLRRESGAAINADEYVKADKQYFPQPGDSKEVIAQKALNRKIAVEAMIRGAGPSYQMSPSVGSSKPEPAAPAPAAKAPAGPTLNEGATATNPQTGEKIIFRRGQWAPLQ